MASVAFALPVTPGRTEEWLKWDEELAGPRRDEYMKSRERLGITDERAYLQHTPQGDMAIIYVEGPDLMRSFDGIATSQEPFDVSFRKRAMDFFSGIDLTQLPPGGIAEQVFDPFGP